MSRCYGPTALDEARFFNSMSTERTSYLTAKTCLAAGVTAANGKTGIKSRLLFPYLTVHD
jgi:hypothetical protein